MKLSELTQRTPPLPLNLELENGQVIVIEQWLRVLPEQRYVGKGAHQAIVDQLVQRTGARLRV